MPLYKLEVQAERSPDQGADPDVYGPYLIEATDPATARSLIGLNFRARIISRSTTPIAGFFQGHSVSRCEEVSIDARTIAARQPDSSPRIKEMLELGPDRTARMVWWPTTPWEQCPA